MDPGPRYPGKSTTWKNGIRMQAILPEDDGGAIERFLDQA
jgi:hypothetical protein